MDLLRKWTFPQYLAILALVAHVLMNAVPTFAQTPTHKYEAGQELSLAEALMVVCTAEGAKTQGHMTHKDCKQCTGCVQFNIKTPFLPLFVIAYPMSASDVWRYLSATEDDAQFVPHALPWAQGPPALSERAAL